MRNIGRTDARKENKSKKKRKRKTKIKDGKN